MVGIAALTPPYWLKLDIILASNALSIVRWVTVLNADAAAQIGVSA